MSSAIQYRPEIDGLRAVAVLAVVAFHLGVSWLPGGFVGVDVFFVISGFLITSIIARQQAEGTFRLRDFWRRRARRLMPAFGAMLALATVGGFLIMAGDGFRTFGLQAVSALTFWANIAMYRSTGNYWGPEAGDFPLLHCWSLSVEEQFYLFFPLAMLLLARLGPRRMKWILMAVAVGSFGLAVLGSRRYPAAAFYLLPTRAWELLIGCLLALGQAKLESRFAVGPRRAILADLGLLMVLASFFLVRKGDWFPAPAGLLPTVGAALLIGLGRESGFARRILSLGPVVYLGKISYSWYLWHWPVIVLSHQAGFEDPWALFAGGLALAIASYHLVEVPTRTLDEARIVVRIVLPVAAVGVLAFAIPRLGLRSSNTHDIPTIWADADLMPVREQAEPEPGALASPLTGDLQTGLRRKVPIPGPVRAVLIGDSHAKSWLPVLDAVFGELGWNYAAFPASAASPLFIPPNGDRSIYCWEAKWPGDTRNQLDQTRRTFLTTHQPPVVVIGARWYFHQTWDPAEFQNGLSNLLAMLPRSQFLIIGQPPELPFGDQGFQRIGDDFGRWTRMKELRSLKAGRERVHGWIREFAAHNPRVRFLETAPYFLDGDKVRLHEGRATLYRDDDHVSVEGVMRLTGVFREALAECARAAAADRSPTP
jgi:peptidoglycan/LPS O-acetylase OafA/YrhL